MPSSRERDAYPHPPVPSDPTPESLRAAAASCRACDLYEAATQVVVGEGPPEARVVMVGEQPGDREDRTGQVFVGPAGQILDQALEAAGILREEVYITNAVKHFRYKLRGKRRIHQTPDRWQVSACLPWLQAELDMVQPEAVVLLGATAAQALLGSTVRIGRDRGRPLPSDLAALVTITAHPSAILRVREAADRAAAMDALISDLRIVAEHLTG
jgi:uracil-DNA glycosylase family protein